MYIFNVELFELASTLDGFLNKKNEYIKNTFNEISKK